MSLQLLNIFHVLVAIAMIAFILVQRGAGATAGAAFGAGASGTVFGARGAGNFLSKSTWLLATLFCTISLGMAVIISRSSTEPDTDLGVVGDGSVTTETAEPGFGPADAATDASQAADLPVIEVPVNSDIPVISAPADEDLPTLDSGAADEPAEGSDG